MIQRVMAASLLLAGLVHPTHATSFSKSLTQAKAVAQESQSSQQGYTNFSGTWTSAKCMGGEMSFTLENSSENLMVNGMILDIGAATINSNSGKKSDFFPGIASEASYTALEWNADKTQLISRAVDIDKSFIDDNNAQSDDGKQMHTSLYVNTFYLENDQLKVKFDRVEFKDTKRVDNSRQTCVFTKAEKND